MDTRASSHLSASKRMKIDSVDIRDIGAAEAVRRFLELPTRVYVNDPGYVVTDVAKTKVSLLRDSFVNRQRILLLTNDAGECTGRLVARVSPTQLDPNGSPYGLLGFFEALNDPDGVEQLLAAGVQWLRQQGAMSIVGPMDGDTWHRYRFNVGPYDCPPFLMEPYNKPYYPTLWEAAGFRPLENYYSKTVEVRQAADKLGKVHRRVLDRGYRLRPIQMSRFAEELEIIYHLSTEVFAQNFLYEPISLNDFLALYQPAEALVDPSLVLIAETPDGDPIGFIFSIVDYHEAVRSMKGHDNWYAKLKFLFNRYRARAVNIKSMGVLAEHRRSGIGAGLICEIYHVVMRKRFKTANLCLIREGNPSGRLDGELGDVLRRYVLYQYSGVGA